MSRQPPFLDYLRAGLSCIPIRPDGSKAPCVPSWKEYTKRLPTEAEAGEWAAMHQGIAIIGGAVSGNLEILDVDEPTLARPLIDAVKSQDPGLVDKLCFVRTPRRNESGQGGCHLIYRCERPVGGNLKLAMSEPEPELDADGNHRMHPTTGEPIRKPRTLLETRGEGGYALTVGCSPDCHPTGNLYEHAHGPALTELETLTAAERETLHKAARTFDRSIADVHVEPPVRGYERSGPGESPGDAFNARSTWPEVLEPHGWQLIGESGGLKRWRRPGKATGFSATTGLISKAGNELLTVFSTNAYPFEGVNAAGRAGVTYSRFAAYALLNHNGSFEDAAKALVKLGYGTPAAKHEQPGRVLKTTVASEEKRYLEMLAAGKAELISLGVPMLDDALGGGVERGEMVVLGGLTSHGKSVCGLQALRATVETVGHAVLVSHEMSGMAVAKRMIASRTRRESRDWWEHTGELARDSATYWDIASQLFLLESCREIDAIEKEIKAIAAEYELAMIVIDHAQLTIGKGNSRYEQLTDASGRFKQLAVKHNCVALVLSQLNRDAAKSGELESHHIKESGALEQDADVVILVKWPWKSDPARCKDPAAYKFKITKNRNRPIVSWNVDATFNPSRQTIQGATSRRGPEPHYGSTEPWRRDDTEEDW